MARPRPTPEDPSLATLSAASRASAVRVYAPSATSVVSHAAWYGAAVTGAPSATPSTRNCTLDTPRLSLAEALTVTTPDT